MWGEWMPRVLIVVVFAAYFLGGKGG